MFAQLPPLYHLLCTTDLPQHTLPKVIAQKKKNGKTRKTRQVATCKTQMRCSSLRRGRKEPLPGCSFPPPSLEFARSSSIPLDSGVHWGPRTSTPLLSKHCRAVGEDQPQHCNITRVRASSPEGSSGARCSVWCASPDRQIDRFHPTSLSDPPHYLTASFPQTRKLLQIFCGD